MRPLFLFMAAAKNEWKRSSFSVFNEASREVKRPTNEPLSPTNNGQKSTQIQLVTFIILSNLHPEKTKRLVFLTGLK